MIHWSEMMAPVYALCDLVKLDPVLNTITSIFIADSMLIIRYIDEDGNHRHVSEKFEL
jgi:hypothetical protein